MITIISAENWNAIKVRLKTRYRQLEDADLIFEEGREEEMILRILNRTGGTRDDVECLVREETARRMRERARRRRGYAVEA